MSRAFLERISCTAEAHTARNILTGKLANSNKNAGRVLNETFRSR